MFKLKVPPLVYMLVTAAVMWLLDKYCPVFEFASYFTQRLGVAIIICGIVIDGVSLLAFFRRKTSVNPFKPELATSLLTSGLYQWTRNPMYLGLLLLLLGWACVLGSVMPYLLIPLFVLILTQQQIIPEEIELERKFGQTYLDYQLSVRRWL
jgi:protein-S-isoprenylcysteine O-methyltransferase Ste14